ncbi:MAG: anhydro-N-acetylmuramic acid kinase [bacterium]|jgi:anhydro-N-acetylmuramic acid kinase
MRSLESGEAIVAGVLSGTSGDGIDVALTKPRVEPVPGGWRVISLESLAFATQPFQETLAKRLRSALDSRPLDARGLALISRDLGRAFGAAASALAQEHGLSLDLVGSHGQTLWHHDDVEPSGPASLQVGDGDWVAEAAGCAVVSDFRQRDLAAGGLGAPISALADDAIFPDAPRPLAILNLGGLANISWLPAEGMPLAFDTGPAGTLLDGLARRLLDAPFDPGGAAALAGRPHSELLARWLEHPFFGSHGPPGSPRSTGRDTFGEAWIDELLAGASEWGLKETPDLLACAVELVAETVARALAAGLPEPPETLLVAGGGVHNEALMAALRERLPVESSQTAGVDPDAREALVFATLAARCVLGQATSAPSATGAAPGRVLGKISPAVVRR